MYIHLVISMIKIWAPETGPVGSDIVTFTMLYWRSIVSKCTAGGWATYYVVKFGHRLILRLNSEFWVTSDDFHHATSRSARWDGQDETGILVNAVLLMSQLQCIFDFWCQQPWCCRYLLISCLLVVQWRRWVAFWKALEELYRSRGVWMPNIDFYSIVSVIKGVRKWQTAAKWQPQPEFHSRGQYLTKLQYDNH